uniref:Rho-GAP domain-containing protein n=1 Tax=Cuerna arida TaxID=1464854 RepID=A0A1B6FH12_9HEMI
MWQHCSRSTFGTCQTLYSARTFTQLLCRPRYLCAGIRNRRLQHEALQHLIQLLPVPNRDTLWALLVFLSQVAQNCEDHRDTSGEWILGNKMDSNNLATLFAPNILHACKPSSKEDMSAERVEERSDAINVIRTLIDNHRSLYQVSAELLDEVYVHMMDSHPEVLDQLLQRRDLATDETEELDVSTLSDERLVSGSRESLTEERIERKVWSREAFTHETAGMGGPDLDIKPRRERGRERRRWREDGRRRQDSEQSTPSRRTSSTSIGSEDPTMFRGKSGDMGVITASIKIPVPASSFNLNLDDSDIPFIEDSERQNLAFGVTRTTQRVSSESSQASTYIHQVTRDSAMGSSVSPPPHSVSSYSSGGVSSWGSSPPTSPDPTLPDESATAIARITIPTKKTPDPQQRVMVQRVTIKSAGEVRQSYAELRKVETMTAERRNSREQPDPLTKSATVAAVTMRAPERTSITPSISSIGGAVLRSKTADIERMLKIQTASKQTKKTTGVTVVSVSSEEEKKMKRKYTDSRHLTRNLPQPSEVAGTVAGTMVEMTTSQQRRAGVVYKRRELISSEPKERKGFPN